ncbi:hypothetical protein HMPREF2141_03226 [Bacteroides uniformis]|nr:hypothetical protein HMPREF2141_03226 [Bacteroides uniformis]
MNELSFIGRIINNNLPNTQTKNTKDEIFPDFILRYILKIF